MFKGFIIGILTTIVLAALCAYVVVQNGIIPAGADSEPLPLESWAARTSLRATLAREAPKGPNPIPLTDENLIAGIKLYGQHCAFCHGTAKGDISATPVAKSFYIHPPQLATEGVENDPQGYTFWKIKHGIRWAAMPAWKSILTDPQIWTLALFLKHMDKLPPAAETEWQKVQN
jgi:thiosulfate dehydrogenase